jgi:hypothetical protein
MPKRLKRKEFQGVSLFQAGCDSETLETLLKRLFWEIWAAKIIRAPRADADSKLIRVWKPRAIFGKRTHLGK